MNCYELTRPAKVGEVALCRVIAENEEHAKYIAKKNIQSLWSNDEAVVKLLHESKSNKAKVILESFKTRHS